MKVIGLAGWSGAVKTTLLTRLIPHLRGQGLRVSVIKHAHHKFDVDVPGKDSWRHREAGAEEVLVSSAHRWALMHELRGAREPLLFPADPAIAGIASDVPVDTALPSAHLDDIPAVAAMMRRLAISVEDISA